MTDKHIVPAERIEALILLIRGHKVILDSDLAALYGVQTKALNKAVKRNTRRFPADFMFQLTSDEASRLRSQTAPTEHGRGKHRKYLPHVFTEQGVAMLSSVLHSDRAIDVNVEIMRAFVRLRQLLISHKDLSQKLAALEERYDKQFSAVFAAIRELMTPPDPKKKRPIGYAPWPADDSSPSK